MMVLRQVTNAAGAALAALVLSLAAVAPVGAQTVYSERLAQLQTLIDEQRAAVAGGAPLSVTGPVVNAVLDARIFVEQRPQGADGEVLDDLTALGKEGERFIILLLTDGTMDETLIRPGDFAAIGKHQDAYAAASRFVIAALANLVQGRRTQIMALPGTPYADADVAAAREAATARIGELFEAALEEVPFPVFTRQTRHRLLADLQADIWLLTLMSTPEEIEAWADTVARISGSAGFPADSRELAQSVERGLRRQAARPFYRHKSADMDAYGQALIDAISPYYVESGTGWPTMTADFAVDPGGFVVEAPTVTPDDHEQKRRAILRAIIRAEPLPPPPDGSSDGPYTVTVTFTGSGR